jgi:hypothetical protein
VPRNPHQSHYNLPVLEPPPWRRRKKSAPVWAWVLFWIVAAPIIAVLLYYAALWAIFVVFVAATGWILDSSRKPKRKR